MDLVAFDGPVVDRALYIEELDRRSRQASATQRELAAVLIRERREARRQR